MKNTVAQKRGLNSESFDNYIFYQKGIIKRMITVVIQILKGALILLRLRHGTLERYFLPNFTCMLAIFVGWQGIVVNQNLVFEHFTIFNRVALCKMGKTQNLRSVGDWFGHVSCVKIITVEESDK